MKVAVDGNRCFGSATCLAIAPGVFDLGPDKKAVVTSDDVGANREKIDNAIALCPAEAISLVDDESQ